MSRHVSHKSLGGALTRPAGHQGGETRALEDRRDGIIQRVFQLCMPFLALRYFPCAKYSYSARRSFFFC